MTVCTIFAFKSTFNFRGDPWLRVLAIYSFDRDVGLSKALKVLFYFIPHGLSVCKW